jgi:hypothetical protein
MKTRVKEIVRTLHEAGEVTEDCMSLLQTSFLYHSLQHLHDCRTKIHAFREREPQLTREIAGLAREDDDMKPYVSVPVHLVRIGEGIEKLAGCIEKMIKEKVLFSHKAIEEVTYLLQRLMDIMRPMSDIVLARNVILAKYVRTSETGVVKSALEYATQHEERLIEGLCIPFASSLFITMLDEIKTIAWHTKEIAAKLTAEVAVEVH